MMIIMRILFIYLLFYSSIFANSNSSNKLHVTFELMKGKIEYMDILEHKKEKFDKLGFKCYFFKKTKFVSLRCNDTKTVENYNKNIQLLKENNIKYKVISLEEKIRKRVVKEDTKPVVVKKPKPKPKPKPLTLGDGYRAYDKKRYTKANVIFLELYEKKKNVETSYALALVAFQREKFEVVRNYLKPYRTKDKKASKLYYDSIVESYLRLLRMKKNDEAVELQKNYIGVYPKLSKLPKPKLDFTLDNGYKAYNKQEYKKAKKIFQQLYKYDKNLENSYAMSLLFLREKKYKEIRDFLVDYREEDSKSSKLFYDSILAQYYSYIKVGRVSRALDLQKEYIELYPALHHLIKPKLKYDLKQGYDAYNKEEFAKAFFIFSALYNRDNSLENSYAIALIAMKNREYAKVRRYLYDYQTQTNKTEKLYYDSILREYEEYMEKKEYIKAVVLLKSFKSQYPQLNRMQEALIIKAKLFIRDGEYYKAEELLRTNDFRDTRDFLFKEIYQKSIKLRADKKEKEALDMIVPYVAYYEKASQLYLEISLEWVATHLADKNYADAKKILQPIALTSSQAQELYYKVVYEENLDAGWNSFHNENYENALTFFENSCEISHQYNCMEGVMHSAYKLKRSMKALSAAEEVYRYNDSQDNIFIAYDCAYDLKDSIKSDYWYKLLELKYKKMAIFKMDIEREKDKIDSLYVEVINNHPHDFELAIKYLYFLKDTKHYLEFEEFMKNSKYNFRLPNQIDILSHIDREHKNRKFNRYFEEKEYQKCYIYGNNILTKEDNVDYKRMHAWCAFHSKHYSDAEKIFDNINREYGRTLEDTDAQFLSAFNDKNYEKAIELLNIVHKHNSFESKEREHAEFYISMDALEEAKKITINITDEEERELLDIKIKESYKFNKNRVDMIASGIHYSKRSIENGRHSFTQYYVPVDFDLYDEKWGHFYIDADILHLYDEFKGNDESNTLTYGLGSTYNKTKSSTNTTFLGNIGFKSKYIDLEIGSTPLGTDIVPKIMGSISLHTGYEKFNLNLKLVRKRDDDSMLSSVGESLEAKGRDIKWGRIFRSGLEFDLSYSSIFSYSLSLASYPSIEGHHVKQNEELKAVAIMSYSPNSESFTYIDYSFIAVYDEYNFNSDFFTYGHGGYFSPQEFMLGSFVVDIANIINDEASWKLKASVGYEQFKVDEVTQYPVSDANSAGLYGSVDGYRESGFTYNLTLGSSYRLTKQLDVIGALSYEKMHTFKDISIGFSFIYSFDKKRKVNLYNFHDGHRVKQLF